MEDWQDIDGINVGNPDDVESAAHARAQQDEQEGKQEAHVKYVIAEPIEMLLVYKNIPEYLRKDGEASANLTMEKMQAPQARA